MSFKTYLVLKKLCFCFTYATLLSRSFGGDLKIGVCSSEMRPRRGWVNRGNVKERSTQYILEYRQHPTKDCSGTKHRSGSDVPALQYFRVGDTRVGHVRVDPTATRPCRAGARSARDRFVVPISTIATHGRRGGFQGSRRSVWHFLLRRQLRWVG